MSAVPSHIPGPLRKTVTDPMALSRFVGMPTLVANVVTSAVGLVLTASIDVRNLAGEACAGLFAVVVVVGTAADGGPAGTQTLAVTRGASVASLAANQAIVLFTAADGTATVTVTLPAPGQRHVRAFVVPSPVIGSGVVSLS